MPSAAENQELGRKTAISLMQEMRFLKSVLERADLDDLLSILDRDDLRFQQIAGSDAAKSAAAGQAYGADGSIIDPAQQAQHNICLDTAGLHYCLADGEIGGPKKFSIDHAVPFKHIHEKQEALLAYLNDPANVDFTTGFLSATTPEGVSITKYFGCCHVEQSKDSKGKDKEIVTRKSTEAYQSFLLNGGDKVEIRGTRRFFRLCYNDIDNLLLLCHSCNETKSADESLEWFRAQKPFLGEAFVTALQADGGLHEGVIVKKVCSGVGNDVVQLGAVTCVLHNGAGKGLGEFVRAWFDKEHPGYASSIVKAYATVWLELKAVFEVSLQVQAQGGQVDSSYAQQTGSKLANMLQAYIKAAESHYGIQTTPVAAVEAGSQPRSGSDRSVDQKNRYNAATRSMLKVIKYMHRAKEVQKLIEIRDPAIATRATRVELYDYLDTVKMDDLESGAQQTAFGEVHAALEERYSAGVKPDVTEIKGIIQAAVSNNSLAHQKQRADAAEQREEDTKRWAEEIILSFFIDYIDGEMSEKSLQRKHKQLGIKQAYDEWKAAGIARVQGSREASPPPQQLASAASAQASSPLTFSFKNTAQAEGASTPSANSDTVDITTPFQSTQQSPKRPRSPGA